jgi:murein DD-endopeptidase MepM/ murein hydrolase activator NlpD
MMMSASLRRTSLGGPGRLAVLLVMILSGISSVAQEHPARRAATRAWSVQSQPVRLVNGSPVLLRVTPPVRLQSLAGKWLQHDVFFSFDPKSKAWYGLGGVSLETPPGVYALQLTGTTKGGNEISFQEKITVRRAVYPNIAVIVAKRFTEPNTEQVREINQGKAVKEDAFAKMTAERQWSGDFHAPVDARISDAFGTQRKFNGKVQSTHQGLDFAVPSGTPIAALNTGTVLLARAMYFEGNCVVLDHGQGLLTLYLHLSEFKVKEGDQVERGQVIGLSGGTGRATGPHLHIAVRWQGIYLNPATLLKLDLP